MIFAEHFHIPCAHKSKYIVVILYSNKYIITNLSYENMDNSFSLENYFTQTLAIFEWCRFLKHWGFIERWFVAFCNTFKWFCLSGGVILFLLCYLVMLCYLVLALSASIFFDKKPIQRRFVTESKYYFDKVNKSPMAELFHWTSSNVAVSIWKRRRNQSIRIHPSHF